MLIKLNLSKKKKEEIAGVGKDVEKKEPRALLVGMQTGAAAVGNGMEVPQKIKNRNIIQSSNSTTGHLTKENKNTNLKRNMYPYAHCSIYNS